MNKKMFLSLVLVSGMGLASACTEGGCAHKPKTRWHQAIDLAKDNADKAVTFVKEHKVATAAVVAAAVGLAVIAKACTTKAVETEEENWDNN